MFSTIFIILIDILALFFIFYAIYVLNSKKPASFMWNKPVDNIKKEYIKNYNRGISFLYVLLGLCFFVVGLISMHVNYRISAIALIVIIVAIIPTLSSLQIFIQARYEE